MTARENYITLPNFLIPYKDGGVEDYVDAPETVGKIVLAVASKLFKGADISANLSPCERGVYRHWLKVAEEGLGKAMRERSKCQSAAAARWGKGASGEPPQAANPSPSVTAKPATVAPVPTKPPATVASPVPVARPRPFSSPRESGERRGGVKSIGEGLNLAAMIGWAGGGIADRINAEPVQAALEIIGETGSKLSENTLKKYLREKGAAAFADTLFSFRSEIKNGEDVENRGAALFARLKELPNISAGHSDTRGALP